MGQGPLERPLCRLEGAVTLNEGFMMNTTMSANGK